MRIKRRDTNVGGAFAPRSESQKTVGAQRPLPHWKITAIHSDTRCNRNAFAITETELRLIAAPAITGLRSKPKKG